MNLELIKLFSVVRLQIIRVITSLSFVFKPKSFVLITKEGNFIFVQGNRRERRKSLFMPRVFTWVIFSASWRRFNFHLSRCVRGKAANFALGEAISPTPSRLPHKNTANSVDLRPLRKTTSVSLYNSHQIPPSTTFLSLKPHGQFTEGWNTLFQSVHPRSP